TGLPTGKNESWRSTSLRALTKLTLTAQAPHGVSIDALPAIPLAQGRARARLVLVNGRYRADLSDLNALQGGAAGPLGDAPAAVLQALTAQDALALEPLAALNAAGGLDGAYVSVPVGATVEALIEIVHVAVNGEGAAPLSQPRLTINLDQGASAVIVEHHVGVGIGAAVVNAAADIHLAPGARLRHYVAQRAAESAFHFSAASVTVAAGATYDSFALNLGGKLARHEIAVRLAGEGASCVLDGAYIVDGDRHTDTTTRIDHLSPGATSREVYKGVVDDGAQAVFQGKIVVHKDAQRTDGHQLNRALLLSDKAGVDAKPELEIYADDVKCSHGCTVGELDDAALFFLRARGIPKEEARALLIAAFLQEAVDDIADEDVRGAFAALIDARLHCSSPEVNPKESGHAAGN
nr:Fe-S cluster assembly protein SufD [Azospirillaceae bacterium]